MLVFDTSAIIKLQELEGLTIPEVVEEVKNRPSANRITLAVSAGHLKVIEPDADSVLMVQDACNDLGETIGNTDMKILALALMQEGTIVTDDYSIQNVARRLSLKARSVDQKGIRNLFRWGKYCANCKKFRDGDICEVCGTPLRRRVLKKL